MMIHPLLQLMATQPHLLADHAEAYADLLKAEFNRTSAAWIWRAGLSVLALICLIIAVIFSGVALMLWAAMPMVAAYAPWILISVPLLSFVAASWCLWAARTYQISGIFDRIRQQVLADVAVLREVKVL